MTDLIRCPTLMILFALCFVAGCGRDGEGDATAPETLVAPPAPSAEPPEPSFHSPHTEPTFTVDSVFREDGDSSATGDTGTAGASVGTICVAPLDDFRRERPRGNMAHDPWGDKSYPPAQRKRIVDVRCGEQKITITEKKGGRFTGLSLDDAHAIVFRNKGDSVPYTQIRANFKKQRTSVLCVYDNAMYDTTQISDKARRRFCKKCFAESNSGVR